MPRYADSRPIWSSLINTFEIDYAYCMAQRISDWAHPGERALHFSRIIQSSSTSRLMTQRWREKTEKRSSEGSRKDGRRDANPLGCGQAPSSAQ